MIQKIIVVRFTKKLPDDIKLAIKALGAHWDDLYDGWVFRTESSDSLNRILKESNLKHTKFETSLPKEYLQTPKRVNAMYGKYATLLKKIVLEENRLFSDIERYEQTSPKPKDDHRPRAHHLFFDEPKKDSMPEIQYQIELSFYKKYAELKAIRNEIDQLHQELLEMETTPKEPA